MLNLQLRPFARSFLNLYRQTKLREMLLELTVLVRIRHPNVVTFWGTATHFPAADDPAQDPFIGLVFELCKACGHHIP